MALVTITINDGNPLGPDSPDYTSLSVALLSEAIALLSESAIEQSTRTYKFNVYNSSGQDSNIILLTGLGASAEIEYLGVNAINPYLDDNIFMAGDIVGSHNTVLTIKNLQINGNLGSIPPLKDPAIVDGTMDYPFTLSDNFVSTYSIIIINSIIGGKLVSNGELISVNSVICGAINGDTISRTASYVTNSSSFIQSTTLNTWGDSLLNAGGSDTSIETVSLGGTATIRNCTILGTDITKSTIRCFSSIKDISISNSYISRRNSFANSMEEDYNQDNNIMHLSSQAVVINCATSDLSAGKPRYVTSSNLTSVIPDQTTFELFGDNDDASTAFVPKDLYSNIKLTEGSPLIGAGVDTSYESSPLDLASKDIRGRTRNTNSWDIGAHQFTRRTIQTFTVGPNAADYPTLSAFIIGEATVLSGSGIIKKALLQSFDDTDPVIINSSWTTGPNDYILLESIDKHLGIPGSGRSYRHILTTPSGISGSGLNPLGLDIPFTNITTRQSLRCSGLQIINNVWASGTCIKSSGFSGRYEKETGSYIRNYTRERVNIENCLIITDPKWVTYSSGIPTNRIGFETSQPLEMNGGHWAVNNSLLSSKKGKRVFTQDAGATHVFYNSTLTAESGAISETISGDTFTSATKDFFEAETLSINLNRGFILSRRIINSYLGHILASTEDLPTNNSPFTTSAKSNMVGDPNLIYIQNIGTSNRPLADTVDSNNTYIFVNSNTFEDSTNNNYKPVTSNNGSGVFENGRTTTAVISISGINHFYSVIDNFVSSTDVAGNERFQFENFDIGLFESPGVPISNRVLGGYVKGLAGGELTMSSGIGAYAFYRAPPANFKQGIFGGYIPSQTGNNVPSRLMGGLVWAIPLTLIPDTEIGAYIGSYSGVPARQIGGYLYGQPDNQSFSETHARSLIKASSDRVFDQTLSVNSVVVLKGVSESIFGVQLDIFRTFQSTFGAQFNVQQFKSLPQVFITSVTFDDGFGVNTDHALSSSGTRKVCVTASGTLGEALYFEKAFIDFGDPKVDVTDISVSGFIGDPPWTACYEYTSSGNYKIVARAQDNRNLVSSEISHINIASGLIAGVDYPSISISGIPREGLLPPELAVKFTAGFSGIGAITADASSRLIWDFGNGTNSNETNPSGFYQTPGNFAATLVYVYDKGNGSVIKTSDSLIIGWSPN